MAKKMQKTYNDQFKCNAVKLLSQPGYTLAKMVGGRGKGIAMPLIKTPETEVLALTKGIVEPKSRH